MNEREQEEPTFIDAITIRDSESNFLLKYRPVVNQPTNLVQETLELRRGTPVTEVEIGAISSPIGTFPGFKSAEEKELLKHLGHLTKRGEVISMSKLREHLVEWVDDSITLKDAGLFENDSSERYSLITQYYKFARSSNYAKLQEIVTDLRLTPRQAEWVINNLNLGEKESQKKREEIYKEVTDGWITKDKSPSNPLFISLWRATEEYKKYIESLLPGYETDAEKELEKKLTFIVFTKGDTSKRVSFSELREQLWIWVNSVRELEEPERSKRRERIETSLNESNLVQNYFVAHGNFIPSLLDLVSNLRLTPSQVEWIFKNLGLSENEIKSRRQAIYKDVTDGWVTKVKSPSNPLFISLWRSTEGYQNYTEENNLVNAKKRIATHNNPPSNETKEIRSKRREEILTDLLASNLDCDKALAEINQVSNLYQQKIIRSELFWKIMMEDNPQIIKVWEDNKTFCEWASLSTDCIDAVKKDDLINYLKLTSSAVSLVKLGTVCIFIDEIDESKEISRVKLIAATMQQIHREIDQPLLDLGEIKSIVETAQFLGLVNQPQFKEYLTGIVKEYDLKIDLDDPIY